MKTTSLETSKELAAALEGAGYVLDFEKKFMADDAPCSKIEYIFLHEPNDKDVIDFFWKKLTPTFTMCELMEMTKHVGYDMFPIRGTYVVSIEGKFTTRNYTNPCNAFAKLCLYCIENNIPLSLEKK